MPDKILFYQLNIDCRKSVELFSGIACYTIHCIELFFRYGLWQSIAQKFLLSSKNFLKTIYLVCVHPMLGFLWSCLHLWCVCLLICVFYCGVQQDLKSFKIIFWNLQVIDWSICGSFVTQVVLYMLWRERPLIQSACYVLLRVITDYVMTDI